MNGETFTATAGYWATVTGGDGGSGTDRPRLALVPNPDHRPDRGGRSSGWEQLIRRIRAWINPDMHDDRETAARFQRQHDAMGRATQRISLHSEDDPG